MNFDRAKERLKISCGSLFDDLDLFFGEDVVFENEAVDLGGGVVHGRVFQGAV